LGTVQPLLLRLSKVTACARHAQPFELLLLPSPSPPPLLLLLLQVPWPEVAGALLQMDPKAFASLDDVTAVQGCLPTEDEIPILRVSIEGFVGWKHTQCDVLCCGRAGSSSECLFHSPTPIVSHTHTLLPRGRHTTKYTINQKERKEICVRRQTAGSTGRAGALLHQHAVGATLPPPLFFESTQSNVWCPWQAMGLAVSL
jgi:hypothetical protein